MKAKSMLKRVLYGTLPPLGAVHDGMADYATRVELDASTESDHRYKNLYAVAVARTR
jgi:hypothetical protein